MERLELIKHQISLLFEEERQKFQMKLNEKENEIHELKKENTYLKRLLSETQDEVERLLKKCKF